MAGWGSIYNTTRAALQLHASELARLQQMAASGARLIKASDGPTEAFHMLTLRAQSDSLAVYAKNLNAVTDSLSIAGETLEQIWESVTRVRTLVTQASSGTYSAEDRVPIAREIDGLLEQCVSLANIQHKGQFLFAGSSTDTRPFAVTRSGGLIQNVAYVGGADDINVPVGPGIAYAGVLVGRDVFRLDERGVPEVHGSTGLAAGAGTPSVRGQAYVTLAHDTTSYLGASGIAAGTSSASGDTVLGNGHTLAIDVPAGTLSLDGGPAVSFTGAETDLAVTSDAGDTVTVDVTGLVPGFVGTVNLEASGRVSIDDGATWGGLNFASPNQPVIDGTTGRVLYIDATGIERTGVDAVRLPGTYDLFETLATARDLMLGTRDLPDDLQLELLEEVAGSLNEVGRALMRSQTTVGARLGAIETLGDSLENVKQYVDDDAASLENADMVIVATDLARRQTLYEMTLAATQRLLSLSLLDFI